MHGKWITAKEFVSQLHDKLEVGERQAYILINKAWKKKEIEKCVLSNRQVIYGLPEFGPPSKQKDDVESDIPLLNIPYSEMEPMVAADVLHHDNIISMVDYCIKNRILDADDPELKKLLDLYRMSRNSLAVNGLWMKVIAHLNGYNSLTELVANRARLNSQLDSLRKMLESK
jgi:hypothetical protein